MEGGELGRDGSASGAVLVAAHTDASPADVLVTVMMPSSLTPAASEPAITSPSSSVEGIATAVAIQLNCMQRTELCLLFHEVPHSLACLHAFSWGRSHDLY